MRKFPQGFTPGMLIPPIIVAVLVIVTMIGFNVLSAVRGYVGGESLWAKSQKEGVVALHRFAVTGAAEDFAAYEASRTLPDADRRARVEMQRPDADLAMAREALIAGGNDPDDAPRMVWLFRSFSGVGHFRQAVQIWTNADAARDALHEHAVTLQSQVANGAGADSVHAALDRIGVIDRDLTVLERDFSATLGEGARWLHQLILFVVTLTGTLLAILGVMQMGRLERAGRLATALERQRDQERLAAERTLRERDEQLQQARKMEAIGRLAGGVAHDFNNLLTVIRGNLEMAVHDASSDSQLAHDLSDAVRAAERASELTAQLLMFSRHQVPSLRILQLNAVVSETRSMLARVIGEGIRLEMALAPDLPEVEGDPGQLAQMVLNLVLNARDAIPGGGTITIRTLVGARGGARTAAGSDGGWAVCEVQDNGAGMDEATRERVFEPFFTTKDLGKGTGLGLATVYGIVTAMRGEIEIQSAPGAGSTFRLWIPAADVSAGRTRSADAGGRSSTSNAGGESTEPRRSASLLIVEDEPSLRLFANRVLQKEGHSVREASDGAQALIALQEPGAQFDLVLTDVVMPEMGGRELVQQMRVLGLRIPVLYMSGYTADATTLSGTRAEEAMLLAKPFTAQELVTRVRQVIADPTLG